MSMGFIALWLLACLIGGAMFLAPATRPFALYVLLGVSLSLLGTILGGLLLFILWLLLSDPFRQVLNSIGGILFGAVLGAVLGLLAGLYLAARINRR